MKPFIVLLALITVTGVNAQQKIFTEDELVAAIVKFHPVAKQAFMDVKIAKSEILSSRGQFDPEFLSQAARKEFGGLTYYDHRINGIEIPTWYGVSLFGGTEKVTGDRVNPEETMGSITYLGFSVQPLQNLLMDKRRAALLQAKNFYQLSEVQRRIAINDLLQEALYSYWNWWETYHVQKLVQTALTNAEKRLAFVRTAFQLGDRPTIDTLEAYTQVQSLQIMLAESYQNLVKSNLELSTFLWAEDARQIQLPDDAVPQEYKKATPFALEEVLDFAALHPELAQYEYKLKGLQIEKKLAFQSLLPLVQLKYNQMGYNLSKTVNTAWFYNNYQFGFSVSMPLRLSEGRGEYQKAKLKIESTRLDLANKQVRLYTKVRQYFTEWQQAEAQLAVQTSLLANTAALQKGEEVRFNNGESSLFLINARELKTIEAERKTIEIKAKTQKAAVGLRWSAGRLVL